MAIISCFQTFYFFLAFPYLGRGRFVLHEIAEEPVLMLQRIGGFGRRGCHLRAFPQHFDAVFIGSTARPHQCLRGTVRKQTDIEPAFAHDSEILITGIIFWHTPIADDGHHIIGGKYKNTAQKKRQQNTKSAHKHIVINRQ